MDKGVAMTRDPNRAGGIVVRVAACSIPALLVLCLSASAPASQRVVLCEEFTNEYCLSCVPAGLAFERLVAVFPDTCAFIQYQAFDPEYSTPWGDERMALYGGEYTPTAVFNGINIVEGAVHEYEQQYNIYRLNHFLPLRGMCTDVTIELSGAHLGGQTYRISALVAVDAGGAAKTMTVNMVQVLDHWPAFKPYHRNGFKQAAAPESITLNPGEWQVVERDFTLDEDSWLAQEDIKIIVWAQAPLEVGSTAEVYQAAIRLWPLISFPGDRDGDGIPDEGDNCPHRYNPGQEDFDGDGVGDICDNCPYDWNPDQSDPDEDGFGDVCDNCPVLHSIDQGDNDGDGIGNPCDSCPDVPAPAGVDAFGRSLGAIDLDCDVDEDDFALLTECLAGPDALEPPAGVDAGHFDLADTDGDGDVDLHDLAIFARNFTGPLPSPSLYVGQAMCTACHTDHHADWLQTIHATAMTTLQASGDEGNPLCLPCHAVGHGYASGFVDLTATPHLANVQCENCHGPGSNHVVDPEGHPLTVDLSSYLCGACHQSCHGLCGDNHHPQYEQWSDSKHSTALWTLWGSLDAEDSCLACHSVDYRLAPEGQKPGIWTAQFALECVTCHDPHGGPHSGQLRMEARHLCADCHTMQGAMPGMSPAQPQSELLHSVGGVRLDWSPLAGPYTQHWWGIPDECKVCHVHQQPQTAEQSVDSGHLFRAYNWKACQPCHTPQVAGMLVASLQEEIQFRLATIAPYFTPGSPQYIEYEEDLTPEEQVRYFAARFNYEMVVADRSYGVHNAPYTRALLAQTEEFLDIALWRGVLPGDDAAPEPELGYLKPAPEVVP